MNLATLRRKPVAVTGPGFSLPGTVDHRSSILLFRRIRRSLEHGNHLCRSHKLALWAECLTPIIGRKKSRGHGFNRRMGYWAGSDFANAPEPVTEQRSLRLVIVNPAYTSHINRHTGCLKGKRQRDRFIAVDGGLFRADVNASWNCRAGPTNPRPRGSWRMTWPGWFRFGVPRAEHCPSRSPSWMASGHADRMQTKSFGQDRTGVWERTHGTRDP